MDRKVYYKMEIDDRQAIAVLSYMDKTRLIPAITISGESVEMFHFNGPEELKAFADRLYRIASEMETEE